MGGHGLRRMHGDEEVDERRCLVLGRRMIRGRANTQTVIALSAGEAELHGLARGSPMAPAARRLMDGMGLRMRVRISGDSAAALGTARRRGLGTVRRIELNKLWLQA